MKMLENIIRKQGKVLDNDVLKIDSFLNHQIDVEIMDMIGKEFSRLFNDIKPDKLLTIESSGIAIAQATSLNMDKQRIVYAKKGLHLNLSDNVYSCIEKSYTKNENVIVYVDKEYLKENDTVLIIDDFLANGEALNALLNICAQAKVKVLGIGVVVCKMYQQGYKRISNLCPRLEVLAKIKSLNKDGNMEFE